MKVIIIGGVAGGASAAARLRRLDETAQIILLERGPYISYANCGLPYYVGGEINQKEALTLQTPQSFRQRFGIDVRTGHEVAAIRPEKKTVLIRDLAAGEEYEESYDKLILSPGGEPARPPVPGTDARRVFTLRTVPDSLRIREYLQQNRPRRAVVMGGGFIGLEMAENLMRAGVSVTVVEAMDHVMAALDYDMACEVQQYLRRQGVGLVLSQKVTAIDPQENGLLVHLENGETLDADLLLLSAGIRPKARWPARPALQSMSAAPSSQTATCAPLTKTSTPWGTWSRSRTLSPGCPAMCRLQARPTSRGALRQITSAGCPANTAARRAPP